MTRQELKQYHTLKAIIKHTESRIEELRAIAESTTQNLSGIPVSTGRSDKVGKYASIIADLEIEWRELRTDAVIELTYIDAWIRGIKDKTIQEIFTMRYIDCLSWRDIAQRLGGGNTEEGVRSMHNRYLRRKDRKSVV